MRQRARIAAATLAASTALSLLAVPAAAQTTDVPSVQRVVIESTQAEDPADIVISVFKPAGASASNPVPVILEGHGWGGSRRTSVTDGGVKPFLDAGYGVVSIDQRGFGESGGKAGAMDPDNEGADLLAIADHVSALDWVAVEDDPDSPFERDPLLGAVGGSYGGGYQLLLALEETARFGATRLDALTPEITWHNLNTALGPDDVLRTTWTTLLTGVAANRVEDYILQSYGYSMATGQVSDGTVPGQDIKAEFLTHGPAGYLAEGIQLDVPVLLRQGFNDTLFNFNEAADNFAKTLTDEARAQSTLIGFNGGHVLPTPLPNGTATAGDACSGEGGFGARRLEFFDILLRGAEGDPRVVGDGQPFHFTTVDGDACIRLDEEAAPVAHDVIEPTGQLGSQAGMVAMAGAPIHLEIEGTDGIDIAGVPTLDFDHYALGLDTRVFLGLSRGTSPANATVIQQNLMPLRSLLPVAGTRVEGFELAGVAAQLDAGEKLFLTITPVSDMFIGHGSRTPGAVGLIDVTVDLPVVDG